MTIHVELYSVGGAGLPFCFLAFFGVWGASSACGPGMGSQVCGSPYEPQLRAAYAHTYPGYVIYGVKGQIILHFTYGVIYM